MTRIILFIILVFIQLTSLGQDVYYQNCIEGKNYRIKHTLLEMSPWSEFPIVESVPHLNGSIDSLQTLIGRPILSEIASGKIFFKFPFTLVIQCDGTITDVESLARKRQDIADSLLIGIKNMPKWTPGMVQDQPVKTVILITAILSGKNFYLEIPNTENGSRLPRKNVIIAGTWIQHRKDSGTTDTLRVIGNEYYMKLMRDNEEMKIFAKIIEHRQDSGYVKLQYHHFYKKSKEIHPVSEFFYLTYSCSQEVMYTSHNDLTYPNKNLLEYNATCNIWRKLK